MRLFAYSFCLFSCLCFCFVLLSLLFQVFGGVFWRCWFLGGLRVCFLSLWDNCGGG